MLNSSAWPLERVLNLMAGAIVVTSLALARRCSRRWRLLTLATGTNLILNGSVGWCPPSALLHRLGVRTQCEIKEEGRK